MKKAMVKQRYEANLRLLSDDTLASLIILKNTIANNNIIIKEKTKE